MNEDKAVEKEIVVYDSAFAEHLYHMTTNFSAFWVATIHMIIELIWLISVEDDSGNRVLTDNGKQKAFQIFGDTIPKSIIGAFALFAIIWALL